MIPDWIIIGGLSILFSIIILAPELRSWWNDRRDTD